MKKYGVMVIGCGHIGTEHLADIYYRKNIQIIAVVDKLLERAELAAEKYGAQFSGTDYRLFLDKIEIDIVIIATYANLHLQILKDCISKEKHVLCEKPIASNLSDGLEFYKTVKECASKVLIGHILRHNRSYQTIKELISSGIIGDLKVIRMVQNHHAIDWMRYTKLLEDTSPVVDCGVHYMDIIEWLTEKSIIEIGGIGTRIDDEAQENNYELITFRMDNGCIGYYEAGWSPELPSSNIKEFIGSLGHISFEMQTNRNSNKEEGDLITVYRSEDRSYKTINLLSKYKDMYRQMCVLIDMIENDSKAEPDIEEAFRAFQITISAQRSIREGNPVRLE